MVTYWGLGPLEEAIRLAESTSNQIRALGAVVVRLKIELAVDSTGRLQSNQEIEFKPGQYFEHHIKLLLGPDGDLDALGRLVEVHGARLSRNARRKRDDGYTERFVTQRAHHTDGEKSMQACRRLANDLQDAGWEILEVESEYVVWDSNYALDAGWI